MTCSASGGDAARAAELLQGARRVLIGAGAGLSAAAGLSYGGERFATTSTSPIWPTPTSETWM